MQTTAQHDLVVAQGGQPGQPQVVLQGLERGGDGTPNPEVLEKPGRRRFGEAYKLRILQEADRCLQPGQLGALLRREGLYSSHLATWRRQRHAGDLAALKSKTRGRKTPHDRPLADENERLRRENQRLAEKLRQAETIIEVQKKVSELLGMTPSDHAESSARTATDLNHERSL